MGSSTSASFSNVLCDEAPVYKSMLAALPPPPGGPRTIVANASESLRTIELDIESRVKANAILDKGSQIIGIRRELWERLALPLRADHGVTMEAANSTTSPTRGLLPNLRLLVGGCVFYVQAQVVDHASYDVLLGRPFHTLCQALVKHFLDGGAEITLTDPNTHAIVTIPTKARVRGDKLAEVSFLGW
jgi:hypothetical protein